MCMQNLQLLPQTFSAEILNVKEENPALCEKAFRAANILRKKMWNFANFLSIRLAAPDSTWAILDFLGNFACPFVVVYHRGRYCRGQCEC
jgi:hypothetical protein